MGKKSSINDLKSSISWIFPKIFIEITWKSILNEMSNCQATTYYRCCQVALIQDVFSNSGVDGFPLWMRTDAWQTR